MLKTFLLMRASVINFNRKLKVQLTVSRGNQAQVFLHRTLQDCTSRCKEIAQVDGFTLVIPSISKWQHLGEKNKRLFGLGLVCLFAFKNKWWTRSWKNVRTIEKLFKHHTVWNASEMSSTVFWFQMVDKNEQVWCSTTDKDSAPLARGRR